MRAWSLVCVSLIASSCIAKKEASQVNEGEGSTRIAGTVHGSPVNASNVVLTQVTDDQLVAFLGGASSGNGAFGGDSQTAIALQNGDSPYMMECRDKGVPLPPPWGDARWKSLGRLPNDRIFALDASLITEVYEYESPDGVCAALPRMEQDGTIFALGMICQGNNGNACFWDNVDIKTKRKISDPAKIRPEIMSDATNLQENCSGCHRGSNAFIVHVGTPLEQLKKRDTASDYKPIGPSGWENPPGDMNLAADCRSCHAIPKLTPEFCSTVLDASVNGPILADGSRGKPTMPPESENRADYDDDIKQLMGECGKLYGAESQQQSTPATDGLDAGDGGSDVILEP